MDKKNQTFLNTKLLLIVCAVLLLAVIVLGAFAYQWHQRKRHPSHGIGIHQGGTGLLQGQGRKV